MNHWKVKWNFLFKKKPNLLIIMFFVQLYSLFFHYVNQVAEWVDSGKLWKFSGKLKESFDIK